MTMHGWTSEGRLFVPHDGQIFWFKSLKRRNVTLELVEDLDGTDIPGNEFAYEDLPAPVRKALREEEVRHVRETSTLAGAMTANSD